MPPGKAHVEAGDHLFHHVIYYCKGDDVTPRLEKAVLEAAQVKAVMDDDTWHELQEYRLLIRVLEEQSRSDESGNPVAKDKKEITSTSLQNPSDPDATYRHKAGKDHKGYVGNRPDNAEPEIMIADGAYSGAENQELAASKNMELITTALSGKETNKIFAGFTFTEDGSQVTSCPMGHVPVKTTFYPKTGTRRALFARECCEKCPHREECRAREQKKNYAVHVSANMAERARRQEEI